MWSACAAGYKANLAAAGESDGRLEQRLSQNSSAFSALSLDNAVVAMPRLQVTFLLMTSLRPLFSPPTTALLLANNNHAAVLHVLYATVQQCLSPRSAGAHRNLI